MLASDTREIEVVLDPAKLTAAGLRHPTCRSAQAANQLAPVAASGIAGSSISRSPRACGPRSRTSRGRRSPCKNGATVRVADVGEVFPGAPTHQLITGNGRDAASINISQQVGANIFDVKAGVEGRCRLGAHAPLRTARDEGVRPRGVRRDAIANVRDAILIGGLLAVLILLVFLRDWRLTAIAALRCRSPPSRRSFSCGCSASRST